MAEDKAYGKELIIDIHGCNIEKFNRTEIEAYLIELCDNVIDMQREDLHWWDYEGLPEEYEKAADHLKGISVCQFISTSNIVMHTIDVPRNLHLNIFSCKDFDPQVVINFTLEWFGGELLSQTCIPRVQSPKVEILQMKGYNFLWINDYLWMWDVQAEQESQKDIADEAYGDVLCVGYGLGLVQRYLLDNPKVTSVTTIEKLQQVIDANLKTFGRVQGRIIIDDYFKYNNFDKLFDCVVGDICDDILPSYLPEYIEFKQKTLKHLQPEGKLLQWGGDFFEYLLKEKEEKAA